MLKGMGIKVQRKMHLSGNYPKMDLNNNASNSSCLSFHGNNTFRQYNGMYSAIPAIEGFTAYGCEQLRETIMKHELVFRQQLQELHRLYKIQAGMMNEMRSKQPHKHLKPIGTLGSSVFAFPSADNNSRRYVSGRSLVDFGHHLSSASGCGSTYNVSRLFDLESPADEYINEEEKGRRTPGGSVIGKTAHKSSHQFDFVKNGDFSTHSGAYSIWCGDASSSNMNLRGNLGLADLNEPVQVEEASSTASVDILGQNASNISSQNGGFQCEYLPATCESSQVGRWKAGQHRREQPSEKTIFGVEISRTKNDACVIASDYGSNRLVHDHEVASDRSLIHNNLKSVPSLRFEPSYQNSLCPVPQMESKKSQVGHESTGFGYMSAISHINSKQISENLKSAEDGNTVLLKGCQNGAFTDSKSELSWLRDFSSGNGKCPKERVSLDFLQNQSQQFAVKAERTKGPSQKCLSSVVTDYHAHDAEDRRSEVSGFSSNKKILGAAIFERQMSKDPPSASSAVINGANFIKNGLLLADLNLDPVPSDSGETQYLKTLDSKHGSVECSFNFGAHIDLNVSVTEEESQPTDLSLERKVKIAVEIDLEAPIVLDSKTEITSASKLTESKSKAPEEYLHGDFTEVAAETLISISSSGCIRSTQDDETLPSSKAAGSDSLQWFVEIIASYEFGNGIENDVSSSIGRDSIDCENYVPKGIDYFELMTLNLKETKFEKYHYELEIVETTKDEIPLPIRPRRGQARRGRQRKDDFQRDVLPGLITLSKNDVTEDIQLIEGLVRATGGTWQSSLSQRNSPKGKGGRGRKRSAPSTSSPTVNAIETAVRLPDKCGEMRVEESRLTGWGKRTRRPPRQRYPMNHPCISLH
ncbi:uncharacterized protein LOC126677675 isoform X2 [Mercurialis annua]|uniref:uncharacterized protein LOC126677675 isoform X2 n=1 Tax=Mercurialis annua TaxID=3986 RepID=UPI00215E2BC5|nr:uncharacterized protein LOC126677675 isoform X2 [Mercurialis annua]